MSLRTRQTYQKMKVTRAFPPPTGMAWELLSLAREERATALETAAAAEKDPATASRLLKYVNSPVAGVSRKIASVQQAVALLGIHTLKDIALCFSLIGETKEGRCRTFDYEAFWSESLARASTARHLAHELKSYAPDGAFTAGLLCQTGRLALATFYPESYGRLLSYAGKASPRKLRGLEREAFGIDHNELAAEMMTDWGLAAGSCEAVRWQDSPTRAKRQGEQGIFALILHLSGAVSPVLTSWRTTPDSLASMTALADRLGVGPGSFAESFDAIAQEWQAIGPVFDIRTRTAPPLSEIYPQVAHASAGVSA